MPSVIICQGSSSALLYVQECWRRDIEPIVVNPPEVNPGRSTFERMVGRDIRTIQMKTMEDYDSVLEKVRGLDPIAVVCGSSGGVVLADRLGNDLGLKHNDPKTTYKRDSKNGMQEALKDAGIRYIRTTVIKSAKDVENFWKGEGLVKAILKFANSAGSVGNKICNSLDEAVEFYKGISTKKNLFGRSDTVVMQEFIEGDEYVVDTVSCGGEHAVVALWKYNKIHSKDHDVLYDETQLVVNPQPGMYELVKYAFEVLDATGFEYGPCHGEYKIDDKGPILIETNPRPHGTTLTAEYLDECLGNHITDVAMDAYLSSDAFLSRTKYEYKPKKYAIFKHLIAPYDCDIDLVLLRRILGHMKSFRYTTADLDDGVRHVEKTVDGETAMAILKLCNSDYHQLRSDCDFLYELETRYFHLLIQGNKVIPGKRCKVDVKKLEKVFLSHWKILIIEEDKQYVYQYGKKRDASNESGGFDAVIYADASKATLAEKVDSIIVATNKLCESGVIIVKPEVFENLPEKSALVEIALNLAGCTVGVPIPHQNVIFATKY